jgi:hypothetical protein
MAGGDGLYWLTCAAGNSVFPHSHMWSHRTVGGCSNASISLKLQVSQHQYGMMNGNQDSGPNLLSQAPMVTLLYPEECMQYVIQ